MRNIIKNILKEEIDSKSDRVKSIVNKYGIERAIKLVVGGIDTIKQAYQYNPLEFLNQFNDLTQIEKGDKIVYVDKDNIPLFMYYPNHKNRGVYMNYDRIWLFFDVVIGLKYSEIKEIIKNWLEETYNLRELTPVVRMALTQLSWKRPII